MMPLQNTQELKSHGCVLVQRPRRKQDTQNAEAMKSSFIRLHRCATHSSRHSGNTVSQESYIDVIIPILERWTLRLVPTAGHSRDRVQVQVCLRPECLLPCSRQARPCFRCSTSRKAAWLVVLEQNFEDWMGF